MLDADSRELQRLQKWKGTRAYTPDLLGEQAVELFNHDIKKKHQKFGRLSEVWVALIPPMICDHTSLASFARGTLTIHVDTSAHLYELKQMLLAGLEDQMLLACRSAGLKKISIKRGSPA
jgi:hypothetical protein